MKTQRSSRGRKPKKRLSKPKTRAVVRSTRIARSRARRMRMMIISCCAVAVLVIGGITTLFVLIGEEDPGVPATAKQPAEQSEKTPLQAELSIVCVGDVMSHEPQLRAQYDSASGEYNYENNFKHVKHYIEDADLALCNVETTFAGKPYTGFPTFSSPDSLAAALKGAGFDVGITANNHMADRNLDGILRTLETLQNQGIQTVGSIKEESEPRYLIQEVNGVKVGIVAFTYETGSGAGSTSLNGNLLSEETAAHINSFNFNTLEEDLPRIKETIDSAKTAGAQVVIAYYHWGEEYQQSASDSQKQLAQETADMGVDVIFASHPHVLQQAEYITAKDTQKKVPVFYSMGNFISNQRTETLGNRYTEQGMIAQVNLTYSEDKGVIKADMDAVPTWVDRYYSGGKQVYEIIPLDETLKENETLPVSGHLSRAEQAREDANGILGLDKSEN